MSKWSYQGQDFESSMIPEGAEGFVYEMQAVIDGKLVRYIGKKNFYSVTKKRFGKKALSSMQDKRAKKYTMQKKLTYLDYYSSNTVLKNAHKSGIEVRRYILKICFSKIELTYYETKFQFVRGVLESDEFLNGNILGRFYKFK